LDWEILLWADMHTLINTFTQRVFLGKGALECYKSLKEGLGKHASLYETVCPSVNSIKNGWEETDDAHRSGVPTSVMDKCHME
jgi:hypothetical protein